MKHPFVYILSFFLPGIAFAQTLAPAAVNNGGGDLGNTGFHVSLTIGELSIQTYTLGSHTVTQGFQQPFNGGAPLPVHWLSLTGVLVNNQTQLEWTTAAESNNDHFDVERSSDGSHFEKFSEIPAAGNSTTPTTYHATDPSPFNGLTFYRIRQVDLDGKFSYSIVVTVRVESNLSVEVFPNPAHNWCIVSIHLPAARSLILDWYDISGQLLMTRQASFGPGISQMEWDIHTLAAGMYIIRCRNADFKPIRVSKE